MSRIDDATAAEAAKIVKEFCMDRGCNDCPINCRWDDRYPEIRVPTKIPANWDIKEVPDVRVEE